MLVFKKNALIVLGYNVIEQISTGDEQWSNEYDYDFEDRISSRILENWDGEGDHHGSGATISPSCNPKLSDFRYGKEPECVGNIWK